MRLRAVFALIGLALLGAVAVTSGGSHRAIGHAAYGGRTLWLETSVGRLKAIQYGDAVGVPLIVVLHGDAPFERPDYQYRFAAAAARSLPGENVVAILRPGYQDPTGDASQGARGMSTGDNYTPEVIAALDQAVRARARATKASRVTLVGHSGGAALAADLAESDPGLSSRLLLVSCPCDLAPWRNYMARRQLNPLWLLPTRSVSPRTGAGRMSANEVIAMLVGAQDDVAPERFSAALLGALVPHVEARLTVLDGAQHNILGDRRVLEELERVEQGPGL
jgi:pimeloyl-ACP methyl ester carboxylesterase